MKGAEGGSGNLFSARLTDWRRAAAKSPLLGWLLVGDEQPEPAAPTAPDPLLDGAYGEISGFSAWAQRFEAAFEPLKAEIARIAERRALFAAKKTQDRIATDASVTGLALSGGGIRSATFGLGLLHALAQVKRLHQFDYLSTVSGGSYVGSFYCGLFARRSGIAPVLTVDELPDPFADRDGPGQKALNWVRQSGRYLAPKGAGDYWFALGLIVRNWLGVQVVIGATLMLATVLAIGFRLAAYGWLWPHFNLRPGRVLAWAPLLMCLAIPIAVHIWFGWAYWLTRRGTGGLARWRRMVPEAGTWLILFAACWQIYEQHGVEESFALINSAYLAGTIAAAAAGGLIVLYASVIGISGSDKELNWDRRRSRMTHPLQYCAADCVAIAVVAGADALGFYLYRELFAQSPRTLFASPAIAVVLVPIGRWLVSLLLQPAKATAGGEAPGRVSVAIAFLTRFGAALSAILLLTALVCFWVTLAYRAAWPLMKLQPTPTTIALPGAPALPALLVRESLKGKDGETSLTAGTWTPPSPRDADRTGDNRCVYRVRPGETTASHGIERRHWHGMPHRCLAPWHLGVPIDAAEGNPILEYCEGLFAIVILSLFIAATPTFLNLSGLTAFYAGRLRRAYLGAGNRTRIGLASGQTALDKWNDGDDVRLADYYALSAAPLHLINVTINETRGRGSNIVQRDRHGRNFALAPVGLCYTDDDGQSIVRIDYDGMEHEQLPLSSWVAISGAAFSTGLGSRTGFPLSQLAGLANVRLGYWWRRYLSGRSHSTQYDLLREFRGDFPGTAEKYWYLSDGGHFENTGAYELVRRRLPFIVVSDNGMDERYEYEDVANLVRKARIDFECEIEFLSDTALDRVIKDSVLRMAFGTLAQIAGKTPPSPNAVAALARLRYVDGTFGTLVLIKPRLTGDGPVDLIRYKAANAEFPQQTTIDQFFDEAQWESYYHLGRLIGQAIFSTPAQARDDEWYPARMTTLFSHEWRTTP